MDLLQNLENLIKKENLFKKGGSFVLGVSGGVDSMTLLYCLNKLNKTWRFKIHVAHLNHGLRKEANVDEEFVKSSAKKYKLPFFSKKVSLPKANIEEAGRIARYAFFEDVKKQTGSKYIVTAHNLNDNAETVLLNLTRGAGLSGLSGMKIKDNNLIRPFLNITKNEILDFAKKNRLKWRDDPSNKSLKYSRNRIRHNVLPELKKINEKTEENIVRSSSFLRDISVYLKKEALVHYQKNFMKKNGISFLAIARLKNLDPFLQKEILKIFFEENGCLKNISQKNFESILDLIKKNGSKEISLPGGLIIKKEYDKLMIVEPNENIPKKQRFVLLPNKEIRFSEFTIIPKSTKKAGKSTKDSVYVDVEKTGKLVVRSKKDGDRIFISKDKTKKIQDIFVDTKIPKSKRASYPLIANDLDEIVWIPFLRQSEKFRATKKTKRILNLKVKIYEKKIS